MEYIQLYDITIINGARIVGVTNPATGTKKTHGLGAVGDPIAPYLDHRSEGYMLTLGTGAQAPRVHELQTRAPRLASGKYESRRVPWAALEAPDFDPYAEGAEAAK